MIIEKEKAYLFKQVNITWYAGVDAVELLDGTFFIEDRLLSTIPKTLSVTRLDPVLQKEVTINVYNELSSYPKREIDEDDLKTETTR